VTLDVPVAIRYLQGGVFNTLTGYLAFLVSRYVIGLSDIQSNIAAYLIGGLLGFLVMRSWVFRSNKNLNRSAFLYGFNWLVCYVANLAVLRVSTHTFHVPSWVAQALAMATFSILFFILCKQFVFKDRTSGTH
jgi:putative flippase GtrA